uniref:Nucleosome assembly protein 1-like 4 n=2 Tax=Lygus hesperus TaxID=30085 RepID=A0A0K8SK89_LYGHE
MEASRVNSEGDARDGVELHVTNSTMMSTEPVMKMRERLQALKALQLKTSDLESQFFKELHALERRYSTDFSKLYEKRNEIIQGEREPEEQEKAEEDDVLKDIAVKMSCSDQPGVASFWLTVFRHSSTLNDMMRPYDEPILEHLQDIKIEYTENPMGFRLNFHFSPNRTSRTRS